MILNDYRIEGIKISGISHLVSNSYVLSGLVSKWN